MRAVKGEVSRYPNVGEVVIVKDKERPCGNWKIARIIKLIVNELGEIPRAAEYVMASGRHIKRSFRLLYPLEFEDDLMMQRL